MSRPRYPALFQVNTRVRLSELAATLGARRHARRHSGRRTRSAGRRRVRHRLVPRRLADGRRGPARLAIESRVARGVPSRSARLPRGRRLRLVFRDPGLPGARGLRRRRGTRPAPPAPSATAACASSSTSCRTTWPPITPGSPTTRTSSWPARRSSWPQPPRITVGWRRARARVSWRTGATRTSMAGPTRSS